MALRYFIVTQFLIQVIFAFSSPRGFRCQNIQSNFLNRQLRTNRCRRQDNPPLGLSNNEKININGITNSLPFNNGMPFGNVPFGIGLPSNFPVNNGLPNGLPLNNGLPNGVPYGVPLNNGLPNGVPLNNGLPTGMPMNNGLPNGFTLNNGLPNGVPMSNGLPNGVPLNNGLPNGVPLNNGLPNGMPMNNGLPNGLPLNNGLPNGLPLNNGLPNGVPLNNGLPNDFPLNNGLSNNFPLNNGLPNGVQMSNRLPNGLPMNNGLPNGIGLNNGFANGLQLNTELLNGLPMNNGLPNFVPMNNGLPRSFPLNNGLPNGLIGNNLPNGETLNTGLPNGFGLNNGLPNRFPSNDNRFSFNFPPGNEFSTTIPCPNINNAQTNGFFPDSNGINNGLFTTVPNELQINNLHLNGFQNLNNVPNVNNLPSFNNIQSNSPDIYSTVGHSQAIQSGLSNFQNNFPVNNEMPNNNPQINTTPDAFVNMNLASGNSIPMRNELPNLNNMKFTFIPLRFDNVPDNSFFNSNNHEANGYPEIDIIQNNALHSNNYQPSFVTENGQLAPVNAFSNYMPINSIPTYDNWGIVNSLPTRNLPLVSPEMFINNLQYDFDSSMPNDLPSGGLHPSYMPIDLQSILPNNPGLNSLRIEGFGNLPIINGLPVAGITETVTVLNGQFN